MSRLQLIEDEVNKSRVVPQTSNTEISSEEVQLRLAIRLSLMEETRKRNVETRLDHGEGTSTNHSEAKVELITNAEICESVREVIFFTGMNYIIIPSIFFN